MADTLTFTVRLSPETRAFIRERVDRGEFASEDDYVSESIEAMKDDCEALERWSQGPPDQGEEEWIRDVLIQTYDEINANPSLAIPIEEVERQLEVRNR